jgi:ferredoxin-NADP reductase
VEFTKKLTRSDYSKALDQWKPGDRTRIKFPLGSFTLDESGKKIAFLSGGIGITPIRSMCRFATDERLSTDIVLLYGNATEKDIIFRDDFDAMERDNPNLRVVHTLTDESVDRNRWKGRTGFIDANMLREEIPDFAERTFYVCGPGAMVRTLSGQLTEELAVPDNRLKTEDFPGY